MNNLGLIIFIPNCEILIIEVIIMININCTLNDCIFECDGKCTLTHVSTPSNIYNPECIYFRPKDEMKPETSEGIH